MIGRLAERDDLSGIGGLLRLEGDLWLKLIERSGQVREINRLPAMQKRSGLWAHSPE